MADNRQKEPSAPEASVQGASPVPATHSVLGMKLFQPPLPRGHISRPYLLDRLNRSPCRLVVISAPAGFGKSTLAIEYLQQLPEGHQVAWLSLDERDNNLQRFLTYLVHLFGRCLDDGAVDASLQQLEVRQAHQPLSFESVLSPLLEELAQLTQPVTVVLDDYHVINREAVHQCMQFLFHHLPPHINILLTSRYQLGVALAKLRLNRQLEELGHQELRFNHQEIQSYLQSEGFHTLNPDDIRVLEERSEGWVTGLRLFTMAIRKSQSPSQFILALKGSEQFIASYLFEEVFSRLDEEVQGFLLDTAMLDSFNAELCNAVRQRTDSWPLLELIQTNGVFLVPLNSEQTWFRYHHLFAEFLAEQNAKRGASQHVAVFGRASEWFCSNGQMHQAVDYALLADDLDGASRLVQSLSEEELLAEQNLSQILSWRSELPDELVNTRPRLIVVYSWALALSCQLDEAERLVSRLATLEQAQTPFYRGHQQAIEATIQRGRGNLDQAEVSARKAIKLLPKESYGARIMCLSTLGNCRLSRGDMDGAKKYTRQSVEEAQRSGCYKFEMLSCFDAATLQMARGNINAAVLQVDEYLNRQSEDSDSTGMGRLYIFKAFALWQQQHLEEAEDLALRGIQIAEQSRDMVVVLGYTVRIMVYRNRKDVGAAFNMLAEVERLMNLWDIPRFYYLSWLTALKCDLWIFQGKLELARSWLERLQTLYTGGKGWPPPHLYFLPGLIDLVYCRLLIADGDADLGAAVAHKAAKNSRLSNFTRFSGVALIYEAAALEANNQPELATCRLQEGVGLLEAEEILFAFPEMTEWISVVLQRVEQTPFTEKIFQLICPSDRVMTNDDDKLLALNRSLSEPISKREMSVLKLITQGLSNQQIADKLFISLHTVKTHARRINNKLEVRSRTQAAARAHELGLV